MRRLLFIVLAYNFCYVPFSAAQPVPLLRAHAHNDYEHDRPLLEALERGFSSIEVDIFLVENELLVAHDLEDVDTSRTIEGMYLEPLRAHVTANDGIVYPNTPPLILLIDIKSDPTSTYLALHNVLESFGDILTKFDGDQMIAGAVTAIISGNRPRELMKSQPVRWAAYDGRLNDLGTGTPESVSFIPLISSNWNAISSWYGVGEISEEDYKKLIETVDLAHKEGRIIRFWATSNNPIVWDTLYKAGVDLLNADDLEGLQRLLMSKK